MPRRWSVHFRPAREADLEACTRIWKRGIEDYQARLNQPPMPDDLAPLRRLLVHTLASDPDRFWVAVEGGAAATGVDGDGRIVGFSSATVREEIWFLAMLFVDPDRQGDGIGAALMDHAQAGRAVDPSGPGVPGPDDPFDTGIRTWGMCTDAVQPISNGLYARRGIPPRIPVWRLFGEVRRPAALPTLPASLESVPFERLAADGSDGHRRLAAVVDGLDRELLGSAHAVDHAFLRRDGRSGYLVRERRGGRPVGYAYGSTIGRLGPLAAIDPDLHPALLGVAVREPAALAYVAIWVPGTADVALRALLEAGLVLDGFPGLLCWSRRDHPFERYIPISLALV